MKITVPITEKIRAKFVDHPMLIDTTSVVLGFHSATITGDDKSVVALVAAKISDWVRDGLVEGSQTGTYKKYS